MPALPLPSIASAVVLRAHLRLPFLLSTCGEEDYTVTQKNGKELLLTLSWDVPPSCLARLCRIEIQVRSNLDRDLFLVLYLVRRFIFWVSIMQMILFPLCGRYSGGSPEPRTCIGAGFGDPKFLYRAQPCSHPARHPPEIAEEAAFLPSRPCRR